MFDLKHHVKKMRKVYVLCLSHWVGGV